MTIMTPQEMAEWVAPVATMIAAIMTAANLGARVTGSGFIVFTIGSVLWSYIGVSTGQTGLLVTNGFLTLVNAIGIWRWLGRQRAYEDGARTAAEASKIRTGPLLVGAAGIASLPLQDLADNKVGHGVDLLIDCSDHSVSYVVLALSLTDKLGERLIAVSGDDVAWHCDRLVLNKKLEWYNQAPALEDGRWPAAREALAWRTAA